MIWEKTKLSCGNGVANGYNAPMSINLSTASRIGNDVEAVFTPAEVRTMLNSNSVVRIWFRKANKDIRCIRGTVKCGIVPLEHEPKGVLPSDPNDPQIRVFDLDIREWRSFKADRLFQIEVVS